MSNEIITTLREIRELLKLNCPGTPNNDGKPQLYTIGLNAASTVQFSLPSRTFGARFLAVGGDCYGFYNSSYSTSAFKFTNNAVFSLNFDCGLDLSSFHVFVLNGVSATLSCWITPAPEAAST